MSLPELLSVSKSTLTSLSMLGSSNLVIVRSSRSKETMEKIFGQMPVALVADHGAFIRWSPSESWICTLSDQSTFKDRPAERILEYFAERTPGSDLEFKEASVAWHFNESDPGHGAWQAKQVEVSLQVKILLFSGFNLRVLLLCHMRHFFCRSLPSASRR